MGNFQEAFLIILSLFANLKLMSAFYLWNIFSVQVGDIQKLCGGKAHYNYDYRYNLHFFLSYVIFDQPLKITFRKSSGPSWKNSLSPSKKWKSASPPFCQHWTFFSPPPPPPPPRKGEGEDTGRGINFWFQ